MAEAKNPKPDWFAGLLGNQRYIISRTPFIVWTDLGWGDGIGANDFEDATRILEAARREWAKFSQDPNEPFLFCILAIANLPTGPEWVPVLKVISQASSDADGAELARKVWKDCQKINEHNARNDEFER